MKFPFCGKTVELKPSSNAPSAPPVDEAYETARYMESAQHQARQQAAADQKRMNEAKHAAEKQRKREEKATIALLRQYGVQIFNE